MGEERHRMRERGDIVKQREEEGKQGGEKQREIETKREGEREKESQEIYKSTDQFKNSTHSQIDISHITFQTLLEYLNACAPMHVICSSCVNIHIPNGIINCIVVPHMHYQSIFTCGKYQSISISQTSHPFQCVQK